MLAQAGFHRALLSAVPRAFAPAARRAFGSPAHINGETNGEHAPEEEIRFLDMVQANFEKAAKLTDCAPGLLNQILQCNSVLRVRPPPPRA
ncbi:hypothetical protein T484DRAFT_1798016 [Baffinella frigidus]|nr:hypothetical protein T484DRAFT_1798016 [Cryptophyta sp. CCMP2293]